MNIELQVTGLQALERRIREYAGTLRNTQTLWSGIEDLLETEIQESISAQKSATTKQKYKDLSIVTQWRFHKGPRDALKPSNRVVIMTRSGDVFYFKVSLPYGGIHQYGNPNNKMFGNPAPIPARPFMPIKTNGQFTEDFSRKISTLIRNWLQRRNQE